MVVIRRVLAYLADAVALVGTVFVVASLAGSRGKWRLLSTGVLSAVAGVPYHVLLEGRYGRTVGKRLVGIVVVREDGGPCTYTAATVRTALRAVDWLPAGYLLGFASIAVTERGQRVGDLLAGTVVVRAGTRRAAEG